jgi:hypothetical protein
MPGPPVVRIETGVPGYRAVSILHLFTSFSAASAAGRRASHSWRHLVYHGVDGEAAESALIAALDE